MFHENKKTLIPANGTRVYLFKVHFVVPPKFSLKGPLSLMVRRETADVSIRAQVLSSTALAQHPLSLGMPLCAASSVYSCTINATETLYGEKGEKSSLSHGFRPYGRHLSALWASLHQFLISFSVSS